jgi:hypothetical protein
VSTRYCSAGNCVNKLGDGLSCSGNNQCSSGVCSGFFHDADGDGFGAGAATMFCGSTPPAGFVASGTDCCDSDPRAFPGQSNWFTGLNACGSWDYNCSGANEPQFSSDAGSCQLSGTCNLSEGLSCDATTGWLGTVPGCGGTGTFLSDCSRGPACTPCQDPGGCGFTCGAPKSGPKTMGCH